MPVVDASGTALVTGASRGLGRAVALELGRRGFSVIATVRAAETGAALAADASADGLDFAIRELELVDVRPLDLPDDLRVVVNNAGAQEGYLPVEAVPLELVRHSIEVNLIGQIAVLQQAIPILRARGEGVICTVTSSSILLASPFFAAYRASKAAMSAVCETMLVELAPFGIRVLEVLPGPVATDGLAGSDYVDAVEHAPYRAAAARMMASREHVHELAVTPAVAAARIVDAILADGGPMRSSTDPMGDDLLAQWRARSDQERLDRDLARYAVTD
jgi:NAD(P)-dependent dehydrogenase (short-subunit alcohol dehydrogenase family)